MSGTTKHSEADDGESATNTLVSTPATGKSKGILAAATVK